jgi:predicted RNA-binding Zn-ribbon protein involved in translation (DUF1610 family)
MARQLKYTREVLEPAVAASTSVAGVLRYLGLRQNGGAHAHISRTIKKLGLDTGHFQRWGPHNTAPLKHAPEKILVRRPPGSNRMNRRMLRRALLESGMHYKCAVCGINGVWRGKPLTLDIDHIDGDFLNNEIENLRFLCPNCHRQTPNFAGKSRGKYTQLALQLGA